MVRSLALGLSERGATGDFTSSPTANWMLFAMISVPLMKTGHSV
jgi:hypothetical protein